MTPHKHFLHNLQPLSKPFLITLLNCYKVKVISTGSLHPRHDITLPNVLLVPSFHFNLISIHKLITQLDCYAILTKYACFLQAPSLKRPLEIGRIDKGLYFLTPDTSTTSPSCFVVNSVPMCDFSVSFVIHDSPYVHSVAPVSLVSFNIFVVPFVTRCVPCNPLSVDNKIDTF